MWLAPSNSQFASVAGVLFSAGLDTLVAYPGGMVGSYTVPSGVVRIGSRSFAGCSGLTSIDIPNTVTSIGDNAFDECLDLRRSTIPDSVMVIGDEAFEQSTRLKTVYFLGDAPEEFGSRVFYDGDGEHLLTIYYLDTSTGFSSPTWQGFPVEEIDTVAFPDARWLVTHSIHYDAEMGSDLNGDGVSLFTAYALDLDPRKCSANRLPQAVLSAERLEMNYYAGRTDVTYRAQTSTDLSNWTEVGVTLSPPDEEGHRTASVEADAPDRFMRLVIER